MTTGTVSGAFAKLHTLHLALHEVQEQLKRGPRQIKAREQLQHQADADVTAKKDQLKQLRGSSDRKSLDLKTNESKIAELKAKLNQATSNKEFDILKGQIEADTVANSVLQDEILELYDKVDRMQTEIKESEAKAAKTKEEVQRFTKQFEADSGGLTARVTELTDEIRRSESGLTGEVAARYRRLVEAHGADAMAPAEGGICGNCRVQVTPQFRVLLNSGNVVFCGSCGRLLYSPPKG